MEGEDKKWYEPLMGLEVKSTMDSTRDSLVILGVLGCSKKTAIEVTYGKYRHCKPEEGASINAILTDALGEQS